MHLYSIDTFVNLDMNRFICEAYLHEKIGIHENTIILVELSYPTYAPFFL